MVSDGRELHTLESFYKETHLSPSSQIFVTSGFVELNANIYIFGFRHYQNKHQT